MLTRDINSVNDKFSSSYESPYALSGTFHIFFRGYVATQENDRIVGVWLAWTKEGPRFAYALCGSPSTQEYTPGDIFNGGATVTTGEFSTADDLESAAEEALVRIKELCSVLSTHS